MVLKILLLITLANPGKLWQKEFYEALSYMKMTPEDAYITSQVPDSFCLSLVLNLLEKPVQAPEVLDSMADALKGANIQELINTATEYIDLSPVPLKQESFTKPLSFLILQVNYANDLLKEATAELDSEELSFLKENLPALMLEDTTFKDKNPYEKKIAEQEGKKIVKRCLELTKKIKRDKIVLASSIITNALIQTLPELKTLKFKNRVRTPVAKGDVFWAKHLKCGWVVIGGPGETIYTGNSAIVIDLGGDDKYYGKTASGVGKVSICIDFSGNDLYLSSKDYNFGSGFFGIGILLDLKGNDIYSSINFSQGSGLFGTGILWDAQGEDKYFSDTHSQGAGSFGIGILKDLKGNDSYNGALYVQGFGGTQGFGAIIDSIGNDTYYASGKYKDWLRYEEHFLSLSQGFGYGIRPYASGGIGLLVDFSGNDCYTSDIFGQGGSYWFALGGLLDYGGNDIYNSYQYAQGSGIHIGIGVLLDKSGNDSYSAKGVSQGCGHDYGVGILIDSTGNDNYSASDLSQGAGNANAISLLIDIEGNDNYLVRSKKNTHGFSDLRRDFEGIGVMLDLSGKDKYTGYGKDNSIWLHSTYGIGIDKKQIKNAK
ncbi:hypothetical protein KAW65_08550 [candidate division WOR-3 bacterium]|nr:hypothetical protein [candidate division WOR-3 bacterium]